MYIGRIVRRYFCRAPEDCRRQPFGERNALHKDGKLFKVGIPGWGKFHLFNLNAISVGAKLTEKRNFATWTARIYVRAIFISRFAARFRFRNVPRRFSRGLGTRSAGEIKGTSKGFRMEREAKMKPGKLRGIGSFYRSKKKSDKTAVTA